MILNELNRDEEVKESIALQCFNIETYLRSFVSLVESNMIFLSQDAKALLETELQYILVGLTKISLNSLSYTDRPSRSK